MPDPRPPQDQLLSDVLKAVGDPVRLTLLRYLLEDEHCVTQCMEHTGLRQSLVSKHLGRLVEAGLVERRRSGRRHYHHVADPDLVRHLLRAAEELSRALSAAEGAVEQAHQGAEHQVPRQERQHVG